MENEITTNTQEVDSQGGWLVTHWTKIWDTREPLTKLDEKLSEAQQRVIKAQQEVEIILDQKTQFEAEIEQVKIAEAERIAEEARELLENPLIETPTSTP